MEKNTYEIIERFMATIEEGRITDYGKITEYLDSDIRSNGWQRDNKKMLLVILSYGDLDEKLEHHEYKKHLKDITEAIKKEYGGFGVVRWELQKQKSNGCPSHFYFVWCGVPYIFHEWLANRWDEITGVTGSVIIDPTYFMDE